MSKPRKPAPRDPLVESINRIRRSIETGSTPPTSSADMIEAIIAQIRAARADRKSGPRPAGSPKEQADAAVAAICEVLKINGRKRQGIPSAEIIPFRPPA